MSIYMLADLGEVPLQRSLKEHIHVLINKRKYIIFDYLSNLGLSENVGQIQLSMCIEATLNILH